jgi:hypothetical protein
MTDLRMRIVGDEGSFQRLASHIPGFAGYRERGLRRKADELVREHLVGLLDDLVARAGQIVGQWADRGKLDGLDQLDRVVGRLRQARDNLRYADYGYSGWWDAVKINEDDLNNMYEYDLKLRAEIVAIDTAVQDLAAATADTMTAKMAAVDEQVAQLQNAIDHREEITSGIVPTDDAPAPDVSALPPEEPR